MEVDLDQLHTEPNTHQASNPNKKRSKHSKSSKKKHKKRRKSTKRHQFSTNALIHSKSTGRVNLSNRNLKRTPRPLNTLDHLTSPFLSENYHIRHLNLADNALQSIDPKLSNLKKLQVIDFSRNQLRSLPEEIFCVKTLKKVDFSSNLLSFIPERFCACYNVFEANFSFNELVALPLDFKGMGRLGKLQFLYVSNNKLEKIDPAVRTVFWGFGG